MIKESNKYETNKNKYNHTQDYNSLFGQITPSKELYDTVILKEQ